MLGAAGVVPGNGGHSRPPTRRPANRAVSWSTNGSMTALATNAFNVLDDKYKLVIGDQLSFRIVEDKYVEGNDETRWPSW